MNVKGIMIAVVTIIMGVILTTGVLIPVISEASSSEKTYTNDGVPFEEIGSETTHTYNINQSVVETNVYDIKITLDDTVVKEWTVDLTKTSGTDSNFFYPIFVFETDNGKGVEGIFYSTADAYQSGEDMIIWESYTPLSTPEVGFFESSEGSISATLTVTNGTVNYSIGEITAADKNYTYCLSDSGDYMFAEQPYVKSDTEIMTYVETSMGEIVSGDIDPCFVFSAYFSGTVDDLVPAKYTNGFGSDNGTMYSFDSATYELNTETSGELIKLNGINATAVYTKNSVSIEKEWEIKQFFVPAEITVSTSMSPTLKSMVSVIPLIVIVGLIIGTVGYFMRRE